MHHVCKVYTNFFVEIYCVVTTALEPRWFGGGQRTSTRG